MKTSASAARLRGDLLLLLTALIWGVAFVAQKSGGEALGPLTCNGMRSLICVAGLLTVIPVMDKLGYGRRPQTAAERRTLWIGGGLCGAGEFLFAPLREKISASCFYPAHGAVVPAVMGNDAGMVGAAMLRRDRASTGCPQAASMRLT